MKNSTWLLFLFLLSFATANAQNTTNKKKEDDGVEINCYLKWVARFEERGAEEVVDGIYTDVIISFVKGTNAECYKGKAEVKDGKVMAFFIRKQDGTYEQVKRKWRYEIKDVTIINGMSKAQITADEELIYVLFIKKIKPPKVGYERAEDPSDY